MSGRDLPGERAGEQAREQAGGQAGLARVVLRPMGSPLPLGFLGLALATTAFAAMELGWVPAAVMAMSATRFAITGVYELTASAGWRTAAGVAGLVLAVVAYYAALAFELEDAHGRALLPVARLGRARKAIRGGLSDQTKGLAREAGVREQL